MYRDYARNIDRIKEMTTDKIMVVYLEIVID